LDETYQTYINRVVPLTLPTTYETQLQNIQKSPKFDGDQAVPFPGYTVTTPPAIIDRDNEKFYTHLTASQKQLLQQVEPGLLVPVPPDSFHITIADLIWDRDYQNATQDNPHFAQQLQQCIQDSFDSYQRLEISKSDNQWQLLGMLVFPRALVVGLVPNSESNYQKIAQLRRSIYQNSNLIALGINQQYHFTAHVTLGYFSNIPKNSERQNLANILTSFNDYWLDNEPQILTINQVELRKFENMLEYTRESDYPVIQL
jgi:hypothetical protein